MSLCAQTASITFLYLGFQNPRRRLYTSWNSQSSEKSTRTLDESISSASYPVIKSRFIFNNVSMCGFVSWRPWVSDILDWSCRKLWDTWIGAWLSSEALCSTLSHRATFPAHLFYVLFNPVGLCVNGLVREGLPIPPALSTLRGLIPSRQDGRL